MTSCPDCDQELVETLSPEWLSPPPKGRLAGWWERNLRSWSQLGTGPKLLIAWFVFLGGWRIFELAIAALHGWAVGGGHRGLTVGRWMPIVAQLLLSGFTAWCILHRKASGRWLAMVVSAVGLIRILALGTYWVMSSESRSVSEEMNPDPWQVAALWGSMIVVPGVAHLMVLIYLARYGVSGSTLEPDPAAEFD
ncbi:MAG: hypothetical protein SF066_00685 [Thermoanaerobaculia bacterium]|nr:hypothetical protein [Thermoanaerobaculia bacterium]